MNANTLLRGPAPVADSDGDGLSDEEEAKLGTDPLNPDSDGDGSGMASRAGWRRPEASSIPWYRDRSRPAPI